MQKQKANTHIISLVFFQIEKKWDLCSDSFILTFFFFLTFHRHDRARLQKKD